MSIPSKIPRELLFAYFAGQATVAQQQQIEGWVEEEPDNEEFFYACLHEWEMQHPHYEADVDAAIAKYHNSIAGKSDVLVQPEVVPAPTLQIENETNWKNWLVAASVLLFLVAGSAWLFKNAILFKTYTTAQNEISTINLPDGSMVVLNAASELRVPRFGFDDAVREVALEGEGRFSIVHTPADARFVVQTEPLLRVEVLGTEFNLAARHNTAKVVLQEGKVKVHYAEALGEQSKALVMTPGDIVTVDAAQQRLEIKKVKHPENYSAWQHGQFIFDNTSLAEIKEMLQDNYGQSIRFQGEHIKEKTVSGSFKAKNANELLQALAEILNVKISRENGQVLLEE